MGYKPCAHPGCGVLVLNGTRHCDKHKQLTQQQVDQRRGTAAQRGYDSRWRKARVGFLNKHPLCLICERSGRVTEATVVDHIKPHKGDKQLFWDRDNWQPLCKPCHDHKTATEDGAFGR
ncbi:MAG TPA: HNH endonuclease [Gammaproteobacteria bacterium]|nr:HNH endonuclease [Gammaproteobacteria bacterium]